MSRSTTGTLNQTVLHVLDHRVLDGLPKHPDISGRRSEYLENSRDAEIQYVQTWAQTSGDLVLCVHAAAGMGKSTLAHRLGEELRSKNQLAAALFMSVMPPDWGPASIVRLIAGELGRIHPKAIPSIAEAIERSSGPSVTPQQLFDKFIRKPIQSLQLHHCLHIIMDAIDEWSSCNIFVDQLAFLEPSCNLVKFIVLGRTRLKVDDFPRIPIAFYSLPPASKETLIRFFNVRFSRISWAKAERPMGNQVDGLAEKAQGVFIWAHTACNILGSKYRKSPRKQILAEILQSKRTMGDSGLLAELYDGAIRRAFPEDEEHEYLHRYLQAIFVLQEPLPIADFAKLLDMEEETVAYIREGLEVLQTRELPDADKIIYPATSLFHLSVAEYLQSPSLLGDLAFRIKPFDSHAMMAGLCLKSLFDLSPNPELPSLQSMRRYIVAQWPIHVTRGTPTVEPGSIVDWKEVPLLVILGDLPFNRVAGWADDFLRSIVRVGARSSSSPLGSDVAELMLSVANAIPDAAYDAEVLHLKIACYEIAVRLRPDASLIWSRLGRACIQLAQKTFAPEACEQGIAAHRHVLQLAATGTEESRAYAKACLVCAIQTAYRGYRGRVAADIEESIYLLREVRHTHSESHPDRFESLKRLAWSLRERFASTGALDDLEEAIKLYRLAIKSRPGGYSDRFGMLNSLARSLQVRFEVTKAFGDLEEAIKLHRIALRLRHEGHPERSSLLNSLACSLCVCFDVTKSLDNLEEAIGLYRDALNLRPESHPDRSLSLNNLASSLRNRFEVTRAIDDLEEAIELDRAALELRPEGHPNAP
ncbi:hypothetical protein NMY22_g16514 [Coprinellus aureogranulatus]|nr:hypothetical protein NMY22_g16514 [Coprinellus aureogranulatus]